MGLGFHGVGVAAKVNRIEPDTELFWRMGALWQRNPKHMRTLNGEIMKIQS